MLLQSLFVFVLAGAALAAPSSRLEQRQLTCVDCLTDVAACLAGEAGTLSADPSALTDCLTTIATCEVGALATCLTGLIPGAATDD